MIPIQFSGLTIMGSLQKLKVSVSCVTFTIRQEQNRETKKLGKNSRLFLLSEGGTGRYKLSAKVTQTVKD